MNLLKTEHIADEFFLSLAPPITSNSRLTCAWISFGFSLNKGLQTGEGRRESPGAILYRVKACAL